MFVVNLPQSWPDSCWIRCKWCGNRIIRSVSQHNSLNFTASLYISVCGCTWRTQCTLCTVRPKHTLFVHRYLMCGLNELWIMHLQVFVPAELDDGVSSVSRGTTRHFYLVHTVPAPVCDQEWYRARMVSWDHFQEVSSWSLSLSSAALCGRQWGNWGHCR